MFPIVTPSALAFQLHALYSRSGLRPAGTLPPGRRSRGPGKRRSARKASRKEQGAENGGTLYFIALIGSCERFL
jgi:hypothetical protein